MVEPNNQKGIIAWFASNPVAANLLMIIVILMGLFTVNSLRREGFPSLEPDTVTVSVNYQSGSARQSEESLAMKIEDQLEDVAGIKSITSSANGSGASVRIKKQSGYDLEQLLQDVKTKVDAISSFPTDAKNPVVQKSEREEHALWLQLYGDVDRHTLQQLAESLKEDLLAKGAISRVSISGWLDPMLEVEIDEGRLQAYGLSLTDVENAINQGSSTPLTAVLRNETTYLQLQASKQAYVAADFAGIALLTTSDGQTIRLGDVATIRDGFDDSTSVLSRFNGHDSLAVEVVTAGDGDITDTANAAREVVAEWLGEGKLPAAVSLTSWFDSSTNINDRLDLMVRNAIGGIVLVFILLALFLNVRVALWVAAGLPFIFFGTLYLMGDSGLGLTLNSFTTFGFIMALGIVVDDAVVVGESVYTTRRAHGDTLANTVLGTQKVAVPTLFGVFTTVAAFFALANIQGHLGNLYSQFAQVVAACLVLSIVESKLILPSHLAHLDTRERPAKNPLAALWQVCQKAADGVLQWFNQRCYRPLIGLALHHRYTVLTLFFTLFVLVMTMPFTGAVRLSFFPDIPGDTVRAELEMVKDASFGLTHQALLQIENAAYESDKALTGKAASDNIAHLQLLSEDDQSGTVTVELSDQAPYDIETFTRQWRQLVGMPEGVRSLAVQNAPRFVDAVRIELRSDSDTTLAQAGAAFRRELANIGGVSGIEDNLDPGQPQLNLVLNAQGKALGLTTEELATQVLQAFSGKVVQRYQRNSDEIEVKVRYPEADRKNAADVLSAKVRTDDGTVLPLSAVADVSYGYTRDSINRIDGKRAVYVSADVDKETLSATELVQRLSAEVAPRLEREFPGLDIHFAGEAEEQAETQASMVQMFLLALLAIYMLIAIPLRSYVQPLLIMTAIPFGVVGAIIGHWLYGIPLGILSLNGIIALSGVVVNDSLLLVSTFNENHRDSDDLFSAITETCSSRLRAVLLTSVTTFAGLMPLLGETSLQAQFLIPAAISLGYGILFATLITLVLIPTLLAVQHDVIALLQKLKPNPATPVTEIC
ncbi:efflux RND transporter permease subunit [Halioxenophilus sp. WMMB6]|uniref:efflux RND transporter permease subunit n=1 Tax=Halioxenophilus sp. WMMB6 TaxID=3073815 RepID=UPI00295F5751|nr:efflux RND transporter permease subunit [Halioxenophilus sp. WMMB6]